MTTLIGSVTEGPSFGFMLAEKNSWANPRARRGVQLLVSSPTPFLIFFVAIPALDFFDLIARPRRRLAHELEERRVLVGLVRVRPAVLSPRPRGRGRPWHLADAGPFPMKISMCCYGGG